MTVSPKSAIAVILAGGKGTRLGGVTKATLKVGGLTLLERVRATLATQAKTVLLSVGSTQMDDDWVAAAGLPVVADPIPDAGPLGGIVGALVWARAYAPNAAAIISTPVDVPFLPDDLIARLMQEDGIAVAQSGDQLHHAVAAWPLAVADDLLSAVAKGERKLSRWQERHPLRRVSWPTTPYDPFFNINTPEDLSAAERIAQVASEAAPRRTA